MENWRRPQCNWVWVREYRKKWLQNSYQIFVSNLRRTGTRCISLAFVRQPDNSHILFGCTRSQWICYLIYISRSVCVRFFLICLDLHWAVTTIHIIPQSCILISSCRRVCCAHKRPDFANIWAHTLFPMPFASKYHFSRCTPTKTDASNGDREISCRINSSLSSLFMFLTFWFQKNNWIF